MDISTTYSLWLALPCALLGLGIAWWLYRKGTQHYGWPRWVNALLFAFRALVVALTAFLLLGPVVRSWVREVRKPVVAVLHDGSSSLLLKGDTTALRQDLLPELQRTIDALADRFEVRVFTYGTQVQDGLVQDQRDGYTDMSQGLNAVRDRLAGPDLGAVIIDGDGIFNRGRDPRFDADRLDVPVYTVLLGDTTIYPDLALAAVESNRLAYLGNEVPILVKVAADHLKDRTSRITISQGGKKLVEKELRITGDPFFIEVPLLVPTEQVGLQRYVIDVLPVEGESSLTNNRMEVLVNVLDDRQKIMLLAAAPHPDLGALYRALDGAETYSVEQFLAKQEVPKPEGYDLVVLHGLPAPIPGVNELLSACMEKGIPMAFVLSSSTDLRAFNAMPTGIGITGIRPTHSDVQATFNKEFGLFSLSSDLTKAIERFPPLQVPFGQYTLSKGAVPLFSQRIGLVRTESPLISVLSQGGLRTAVVCGEGIWRWRLADQQLHGSTEHFDGLFRKLVQLLADRNRADRFRIEVADVFDFGQPVVLLGEVYDANYELVTDAEVELVLTDAEGNERTLAFTAGERGHRLQIEGLPEGRYTFQASTRQGGEALTEAGEFVVRAVEVEQARTVADHRLMSDLALRTGGRQVVPGALQDIVDDLNAREGLQARSYSYASTMDLVGLKWPLFLLLALLTLEWAMRRWNGHY